VHVVLFAGFLKDSLRERACARVCKHARASTCAQAGRGAEGDGISSRLPGRVQNPT